ncbi:MAG: hypothetical protein RR313_08655 [Anaerovoracaceae bacterium]
MALSAWNANNKLIDRITLMICNSSVSHAYIIEGDSCVNKELFAKDFVKAIVCKDKPGIGCDCCLDCNKINHDNYEDLYMIKKDDLSVKDGQIFKLQDQLKKKPIGGDRNFAIIANADTMTIRAQNRLLKTLEEPTVGTVLVLLSENRENLLDTVKSRCIIYRLDGIEDFDQSNSIEFAREVVKLILDNGKFIDIKNLTAKNIKSKDDAFSFLDGMERLFREYLVDVVTEGRLFKKEDIVDGVRNIEEARRDLLANVNYNYAIKNLLIKIGG